MNDQELEDQSFFPKSLGEIIFNDSIRMAQNDAKDVNGWVADQTPNAKEHLNTMFAK